MVLATKLKNINPIIKVLCVLLSAVIMGAAFSPVLGLIYDVDRFASSGEDLFSPASSGWVKHLSGQLDQDITAIFAAAASEEQFEEYKSQFKYDEYGFYYLKTENYAEDEEVYKEYVYINTKKEYETQVKWLESLKFYAYNKETKKVLSNLPKDVNYKDIPSKAYSIVWNNGFYNCSQELEGAAISTPFSSEKTADFVKDIYVCLYLDTEGCSDNYAEVFEEVKLFKTLFPADKLASKLIMSTVLTILSIALLAVSCSQAGNRLESGKVKLCFIDYVPLDIHFLLSGGLVAAAIGGMVACEDELYDILSSFKALQSAQSAESLLNFFFMLLAGAAWLVIAEYLFSLVRVCRSGRKIYKTCLIFFIPYLIVKLVKKIIAFFSFKPKYIKKHLALAAGGYAAINLFLFFISFAGYEYNYAILVFCLFTCIIFNLGCAAFVLRYFYLLDKIIAAAVTGTAPQVNFMKLPVSLRYLCSAMQGNSEMLQKAVEKALKNERMKTELITNVSHDLKTPLTSIITYIELLKSCEIEDETQKEYIEIIDSKGKKLKFLIDDLIEASKLTSGVVNVVPVELSLSELATQVIVENSENFENNGLELIFKGEKSKVCAFADGSKTYRIFENLISNALKYSAKGSRVYCEVYETGNAAVFEIKNISCEPLDISAQELKERFVRGDKSRSKEGNGLGLSIAESLCAAQGGRLELSIDADLFKAKVILPKAKFTRVEP